MRLPTELAALAISAGAAHAQALVPMKGVVQSQGKLAKVRVQAFNPYRKRMRMEVKVYDADFRQVRALVAPWGFGIGENQWRAINVAVPFNGRRKRRLHVCVEARPFAKASQSVRTRVCGKFIARQR